MDVWPLYEDKRQLCSDTYSTSRLPSLSLKCHDEPKGNTYHIIHTGVERYAYTYTSDRAVDKAENEIKV
jgi:hypothetical protein